MKLSLLMLILNAILLIAWVAVAILFTVQQSVNNPVAGVLGNIVKGGSQSFVPSSTIVSRIDSDESIYEQVIEEEEEEEKENEEGKKEEKDENQGEEEVKNTSISTSTSTTTSNPKGLSFPTKPDSGSVTNLSQGEWAAQVCGGIPDTVCHEVFIVKSRKTTFCSAAKVASTTTKQYFYDISENELVIPSDARFGVHQANWKRFGNLDQEGRAWIMENSDWTHVFFWKHVLERFISGYLDKVVTDCKKDPTDKPHLAIYHYIQYGFTCEEHGDLESFVNFMETVPKVEGHFAPQTPLCNYRRFPYTDVIRADEHLNESLQKISAKLGVEHPEENKKTTKHKTGAKEKMVAIFKDKPHLIKKILNMFQEDCDSIPESCDVKEIMAAIEEENKVH